MSIVSFIFLLQSITSPLALVNLPEIEAPADAAPIHNHPLAESEHSSSFLLTIRAAVPSHYHQYHTEQIYVLEGSARMRLADKELMIRPGDYLLILPGTVHGVLEVTSDEPLKVLSIQSPRFDPSDRVMVQD
jgi:mannose-6-phosphate isomerase-like protein (cupin superfamily)